MPLIPLNIPPGQYRNGTEYQSQGRWRDGNLVRWHEGALRPVGGWRQRGTVDLNAVVRNIAAWEDNSGNRRVAFGTHDKLYAMTSGNVVSDITPVGFTSGRVDATAFTGYGGSTIGNENVYDFFQVGNVNHELLSEDYFFCHKYRELGGSVWAAPWCELGHFGSYCFNGQYSEGGHDGSPVH